LPNELPNGITHGDLWADNAIFDKYEISGIIDFESAYHGKNIFDIGQTAIGACRDNGEINYQKVQALVRGYESVRPLEDRERQLLRLGASHAAAVISIWRFAHFNIRCQERDNTRYGEAVQLSDSLKDMSNDEFMGNVFNRRDAA